MSFPERVSDVLCMAYGVDVPERDYLKHCDLPRLYALAPNKGILYDLDCQACPRAAYIAVNDALVNHVPTTQAFWLKFREVYLERGGIYKNGHKPPLGKDGA